MPLHLGRADTVPTRASLLPLEPDREKGVGVGLPGDLRSVCEELGVSDVNERLITKYNFIKNLPFGFTGPIDPKAYYPNIQFEFDAERPVDRDAMDEMYW